MAGLFVTCFALNNAGPYLGSPHLAAFRMYSGLSPVGDNQLFLPDLPLFDAGTYVRVLEVRPLGQETTAARDFRRFADLLNAQRRLLHLNFVRYHLSRACAAAPDAGSDFVSAVSAARGEPSTTSASNQPCYSTRWSPTTRPADRAVEPSCGSG